jgi:hypothetical protein
MPDPTGEVRTWWWSHPRARWSSSTNSRNIGRRLLVVIAASCCESARLLVDPKSTRHRGDLADSSGVVGKYLPDSTGLNVSGFVPVLLDTPPYNRDGARRRSASRCRHLFTTPSPGGE